MTTTTSTSTEDGSARPAAVRPSTRARDPIAWLRAVPPLSPDYRPLHPPAVQPVQLAPAGG